MASRPFLRDFWRVPEIDISGGAFVMAAVWLVLVPVQWLAAALLAGAVHELGHLILLAAQHRKVWRIQIGAFGARIETEALEPWPEFCATLAGPAAGMMLCLCWKMIPRTAVCALIQSLYNLLPICPMDGGRALRSLRKIRRHRRNLEKSVAKDDFSGYNDSD